MKSNLDTTRHDYVGAVRSRKLTIEANGKAFKELISGIYSDKAYAIARETMANCVDSHVQAGTPDRPFDIKVPTHLEPEYVIRDYGVSMTDDTVFELYSTLFRSTKDDPNSDESNKFVGKFGLGSKSPFSYTDAFQLTAFLDGEARYYDISFNGGEPQTSLFLVQETDEENGIMITFPVDPKDCPDFERAIVRACEGLPVLPNFLGRKPHIPQRNIIRQGERWKLLDSTATGRAEAKQGTVLYPLNKNAVIDCPHELHPLFELTLHLEFPIGELDVVTSREALSYDEDTSKNIIRGLEAVRDDLRSNSVAYLAAAETYHQFNTRFAELKKRYTGHLWTLLALGNETFQGKKPVDEYILRIGDKKVACEVEVTTLDGEKKIVPSQRREPRFGDLEFDNITGYLTTSYGTLRRFKDQSDYYDRLRVPATVDKIVLIVEDQNIRPRYTQQRLDILRVQGTWRSKNVACFWVRHTADPEFAIKRFRACVGRAEVEIVHLKDVPYAPVRWSDSSDSSDSVYVPDDYKIIRNGWSSPEEGDVAPAAAYYVPLYKNEVEGYSLSTSELVRIRDLMVQIGEPDLPVIGVPKTRRSQIKKNPAWVELLPRARDVLPEVLDVQELTAYYVNQQYRPSDTHKKVVKLQDLLGEKLFNPLVEGTSIPAMLNALDDLVIVMNESSKNPMEVIRLIQKFREGSIPAQDEAIEAAGKIVEAYEEASDRVAKDFLLLKHLTIPTFRFQDRVISFEEAKERRLAVLPFYAWLKTQQRLTLDAKGASTLKAA
ncbi:hypothetical protein HNR26_002339 [Rhizobium rosettiformans]|uniref:Uncharacterized protein n=2 Tax=Rhizobium rosettiformans TaxID=1368430 RepID=A0A4S8Q7S7_9HYPH|nr:hypothetical protein [Rhizobium rosettiformans]MBB5276287.1 hypothetical protein [Rhizobium rosettiformans]THV36919.1 hypothetical protein FAA86_10515 [Rhizobium rosettiformans W3]